MFKIERSLTVIAIAAISLPLMSAAEAKCRHEKPPGQTAIYSPFQFPATSNNQIDEETKMFIPPALDPNYHGSNGG